MRNTFSIFFAIAILWFPCISGAGQIYKWVDENGITHFSDRMPTEGKTDDLERMDIPDSRPQFVSDPTQKEIKWPDFLNIKQIEREASNAKVELYTTSWCGYCKKAKAFFNKKGIRFVEYDIEKDRAARERKQKLIPGSGVPVAVINGKLIQGFSPASYESALKRGGETR